MPGDLDFFRIVNWFYGNDLSFVVANFDKNLFICWSTCNCFAIDRTLLGTTDNWKIKAKLIFEVKFTVRFANLTGLDWFFREGRQERKSI